MIIATLLEPLLAIDSRERWTSMGDHFSGKNAELNAGDLIGLAVMVAGLVLLFVVLNKISKLKIDRPKKNPFTGTDSLFRRLCVTHGLARADGRLVRRLATEAGLKSPAEAFLRPDLFERVLASKSAQAKPLKAQIQRIADTLFTGLGVTGQEAPPSQSGAPPEHRAPGAAEPGGDPQQSV
ncbi:hypothetical protein Mal64_00090 [Pseudobythopirellula maris]|uniref:Uncharacterized protein n=1 Tax=Pseudobythopirellula maris TaxID=2527991 RepID=A0A5C5ZQ40_9BACT|nr:hypothetical protein [Pseudobythopirellula maris]TWT89632.1 hypothetical protein Mal64_00090 [Pseudobythopirellula maris]